MITMYLRVSKEHPYSEEFNEFGGKLPMYADNYSDAYNTAIVLLDITDDDRFEYGDLMFYNKGVLIEIIDNE